MVKVPNDLKKLLKKQHYGFTGEHSAVKICEWTKKSIRNEGYCYKQAFYGIRSHLCCQISPSVGFCQNRCIFCWREIDLTVGNEMDNYVDEPNDIIDNSILMQRKQISGFGGTKKADLDKLKEAQEPMHFAISLTGEPTLYPKLNELIKTIHNRGKTTFVVTNGLLPDKIKNIEPPTQLYVSVDAPNKTLFEKIDRPTIKNAWSLLNETLENLKSLKSKTRTTLRFTLIKDINMTDVEGWADIIKKSDPLFIEVKAYMYVGSSRLRLKMENMPLHEEVKEFSEKIAKASGYKVIDDKSESRVVLLAKDDFEERIMKF
jgi:tRNA wybutosine-synthesizing protein 1